MRVLSTLCNLCTGYACSSMRSLFSLCCQHISSYAVSVVMRSLYSLYCQHISYYAVSVVCDWSIPPLCVISVLSFCVVYVYSFMWSPYPLYCRHCIAVMQPLSCLRVLSPPLLSSFILSVISPLRLSLAACVLPALSRVNVHSFTPKPSASSLHLP